MEKKKVLAGGVFNMLHPGHIRFLKEARKLGTELIVIVASDKTVLEEKGFLAATAEERAGAIKKLGLADRVLIGKETGDRMWAVRQEMPDIIAIGFDQDRETLERELKKAGLHPEIVRIGKFGNYSTRKILKRKME